MALTGESSRRWAQVLDSVAGMLPSTAVSVVVDGAEGRDAVFADQLADTLRAAGRRCARLPSAGPPAGQDTAGAGPPGSTLRGTPAGPAGPDIADAGPPGRTLRTPAGPAGPDTTRADRTADAVVLADGPRWRAAPLAQAWDVVIWLRGGAGEDREDGADIVVDLQDPAWPVIRHVATRLADHGRWYVTENRAFFAAKAATWDAKFGDDLPAYAQAVAEARLPPGGVVVDVGCGTGRALPALRAAVGDAGVVIGLDLTPQMLDVARARGRAERASLLLGDARRLPLRSGCVDGVFAAGLVMHLPDPQAGLAELARVTRPGGRLALFHPSGRAALAARRGRKLRPDEPLSEGPLRESTRRTGWRLDSYDDPPHRFLALATRE
jgi:SAM-dependent methyltransferase